MKNKTPSHTGRSFPILMLFCTAVFMLVFISFIVKLASVVAKSGFDGRHRFTIVVRDTPVKVISFAPDDRSLAVLEIPNAKSQTKKQLAAYLHIPVDGVVTEKSYSSVNTTDTKAFVEQYMQGLFFSFAQKNTDITVVDAFRLWLFSRDVDSHEVYDDALSSSLETTEEAAINKVVSRLFWDDTVSKENIGIQVINASGISGIGNDFAQTLTNIGANVAAVSTAHAEVGKTTITYSGERNYTVVKLEKLFGLKASAVKKQEMFGIIVTIGKDTVGLIEKK